MIGWKKLSTIREELDRALAATGDDPIRWLEERMTAAQTQRAAAPGESPVIESLRRFLETTRQRKRRRRRVAAKK